MQSHAHLLSIFDNVQEAKENGRLYGKRRQVKLHSSTLNTLFALTQISLEHFPTTKWFIIYFLLPSKQYYKKCMNVIIPSKRGKRAPKSFVEKPNCGSSLINNYAISQVKIFYVEFTFSPLRRKICGAKWGVRMLFFSSCWNFADSCNESTSFDSSMFCINLCRIESQGLPAYLRSYEKALWKNKTETKNWKTFMFVEEEWTMNRSLWVASATIKSSFALCIAAGFNWMNSFVHVC